MARWRKSLGALTAISLTLSTVSADAQSASANPFCMSAQPPKQPAEFGSKQMVYRTQVINGQTILLAAGSVGSNEGQRLRNAINRARRVDEVWLLSPGGAYLQGFEMGRVLREKGLMVRVPKGFICASSCALAVLGGPLRAVDPGAFYGIHMFSAYGDPKNSMAKLGGLLRNYDETKKSQGQGAAVRATRDAFMREEQRNAKAAAELARYLVEMSASLEFLTGMTDQPFTGMCFLNTSGLRRYNVANIQ